MKNLKRWIPAGLLLLALCTAWAAELVTYPLAGHSSTVAATTLSTNESAVVNLHGRLAGDVLVTASVSGSSPSAIGANVVFYFAAGVPNDTAQTNYVYDTLLPLTNPQYSLTLVPNSNQFTQVSKRFQLHGAHRLKLIGITNGCPAAISNIVVTASWPKLEEY